MVEWSGKTTIEYASFDPVYLDNPQSHVYFPTTATVSLPYVMENGSSAEIAIVGNELVMTQELIANMLGCGAKA